MAAAVQERQNDQKPKKVIPLMGAGLLTTGNGSEIGRENSLPGTSVLKPAPAEKLKLTLSLSASGESAGDKLPKPKKQRTPLTVFSEAPLSARSSREVGDPGEGPKLPCGKRGSCGACTGCPLGQKKDDRAIGSGIDLGKEAKAPKDRGLRGEVVKIAVSTESQVQVSTAKQESPQVTVVLAERGKSKHEEWSMTSALAMAVQHESRQAKPDLRVISKTGVEVSLQDNSGWLHHADELQKRRERRREELEVAASTGQKQTISLGEVLVREQKPKESRLENEVVVAPAAVSSGADNIRVLRTTAIKEAAGTKPESPRRITVVRVSGEAAGSQLGSFRRRSGPSENLSRNRDIPSRVPEDRPRANNVVVDMLSYKAKKWKMSINPRSDGKAKEIINSEPAAKTAPEEPKKPNLVAKIKDNVPGIINRDEELVTDLKPAPAPDSTSTNKNSQVKGLEVATAKADTAIMPAKVVAVPPEGSGFDDGRADQGQNPADSVKDLKRDTSKPAKAKIFRDPIAPAAIIHSGAAFAAERKPDIADKKPGGKISVNPALGFKRQKKTKSQVPQTTRPIFSGPVGTPKENFKPSKIKLGTLLTEVRLTLGETEQPSAAPKLSTEKSGKDDIAKPEKSAVKTSIKPDVIFQTLAVLKTLAPKSEPGRKPENFTGRPKNVSSATPDDKKEAEVRTPKKIVVEENVFDAIASAVNENSETIENTSSSKVPVSERLISIENKKGELIQITFSELEQIQATLEHIIIPDKILRKIFVQLNQHANCNCSFCAQNSNTYGIMSELSDVARRRRKLIMGGQIAA
jgi:hypothetical protein